MPKPKPPTASTISVHCSYARLADVTSLIPNPRNPNKHSDKQVALLAKVIRHQGWRAPITISKRSGFIVTGHGRLAAALLLQVEQVPIDEQDFATEADEWAHLVADNRLAELAEIDDEAMKELLSELKASDFKMDFTGFDAGALESFMNSFPEDSPKSDLDRLSGRGPYHVKDACFGAFAFRASTTTPNYKTILKSKNNFPEVLAKAMIDDFTEFISRPGPALPPWNLCTMPATSKIKHPIKIAGETISKILGIEWVECFSSAPRKTRGIHAEESASRLIANVDGKRVLLLDDVITTGRTIRNCVNAIHKSGGSVWPFAWMTYQ